MSEQQLPPTPDSTPKSSGIPMGWRIALGITAIAIIAVLLWQNLANRPDDAATETPAPAAIDLPPSGDPAIDDENSPQTLFELGNTLYESNQPDKAIQAYLKAVAIKPDFSEAYANMGAVYYAQKNLDLAEESYTQAKDLSPQDADIAYNLGAIYLQQSLSTGVPDQARLAEAIALIEEAVALNPRLAQPYYGLGVAYQLTGNAAEAIAAFEQFLALDDGSDQMATSNATKILQELKSMQ